MPSRACLLELLSGKFYFGFVVGSYVFEFHLSGRIPSSL